MAMRPLRATTASTEASRLMQASMAGGSAETEQTKVVVRPPRSGPARAVTTATEAATERRLCLKASASRGAEARMPQPRAVRRS